MSAVDRGLFAPKLNGFATQLYAQIAAGNEGKNLAFSPLNVAHALAITAQATTGNTRQEIIDAINLSEGPGDRAFSYSLERLTKGVVAPNQLSLAANLWTDNKFPVEKKFTDAVSSLYGPAHQALDFQNDPEGARKTINAEVARQTADLVREIFPAGTVNSDMVMAITTAIYLKMAWLHQFDKDLTRQGAFILADNSQVQADLMSQAGVRLPYLYDHEAGVKVLELPCKDSQVSFVALLPYKEDAASTPWNPSFTSDIKALEAKLTPEKLAEWLTALDLQGERHPLLDRVVLPRFEVDSGNMNLIPALQALGIREVFGENSDFSALSSILQPGEVVVGQVRHQAVVKINEEGGEAAAATAVGAVRTTSVRQPLTFVADRPFVYLFRDKQTGHVLFLGRVSDPTKKA